MMAAIILIHPPITASFVEIILKLKFLIYRTYSDRYSTSVVLCGQDQKCLPKKKNMAVHPLSTFTHAPKRSPTVPNAGNSIAFIGG
jgi:hypothetical protein